MGLGGIETFQQCESLTTVGGSENIYVTHRLTKAGGLFDPCGGEDLIHSRHEEGVASVQQQ